MVVRGGQIGLTFGWKTVQVIKNQMFTDNLLITHIHYFNHKIRLRKIEIISINKMKKKKFTSEIEKNGLLSFLDIKTSCKKFVPSVYFKPIFCGIFKKFKSFIPQIYKSGSFGLFCNFESFN